MSAVIDVHGHVTPPELMRRLPMPPSLGDVDGMVERKAAAGIDMTIVGSPVGAGTMVPLPGVDNHAQSPAQLEAFHEWLAETVRDRADHLRAYVWVDPFGDDGALARAAQRLAQDEFVGLIANTSVRGRLLDDAAADSFFALAAEHAAPVLLHAPAEPLGTDALRHAGLVEHVARPCDVTIGVAAVLFAGWLERYPGLRLIASAGGGALPLLVEKLDLAWARGAGAPSPDAAADPPPPRALLRRVHVDTATPSALAVRAAVEAFGAERVLFGTDSPPMTAAPESALALVDALPASERALVRGANARALFGLDGGAR